MLYLQNLTINKNVKYALLSLSDLVAVKRLKRRGALIYDVIMQTCQRHAHAIESKGLFGGATEVDI